jgi:uncharacterized protein
MTSPQVGGPQVRPEQVRPEQVGTDSPRPTSLSQRALGPDLARGFMLLFIALANSHYFLRGSSILGGFPQDVGTVDSAVAWLLSTFVDGRAFPMFGLLFGYGVAQIVRRHEALGPRAVRRLLWRRSSVLIVVGFLHAVLLFVGDILTAYGVLLLVGAWMVRWRVRWLLLVAFLFFVLTSLPGADSLSISSEPPDAAMLPPDVAAMFTERPLVSLLIGTLGPVGFMCPFVLGLWAGRRRILERPAQHRTLLRVLAAAGLGAAWLGAQPAALLVSGVIERPDQATLNLIGPLHDATGVLGGLGYAALLSLLAVRFEARRPRAVEAIAALGQRSMTFYLSQSVVWALAFTPFLLDLSGTLTIATTALLAVATWLTTVALADWMRRTGRRGPFEVLTRRVTYRRRPPRVEPQAVTAPATRP